MRTRRLKEQAVSYLYEKFEEHSLLASVLQALARAGFLASSFGSSEVPAGACYKSTSDPGSSVAAEAARHAVDTSVDADPI